MFTTPSIATRYTARYGVRHPFACAGLAFAGMTPDLAIAVCKAGGIGALGVGFTPHQVLREYIRTIRAATDAPFHINFITCFENDAQVRVCAEERVPIVSWHWGHPSQANRQLLREAGVVYWEQVGSIDDARRAVDAGAEAVIAQGYEAGGTTSRACPTSLGYRRWPCCR
jgi:NAD(P)H-dependent flavin oxidoreductase YrpB (nitropropane dioxygenase family)